MAVAPAFTPASSVPAGLREDWSAEAIKLIDPADAPCYKTHAKPPASGLYHQWLTDRRATIASLATATAFEDEPSYATTNRRALKGNRIQYFEQTWNLPEVLEIIAQRGGSVNIASEVRREIELRTVDLIRQVEFNLLSAQVQNVSGTTVKHGGFFSEVPAEDAGDYTVGGITDASGTGNLASVTEKDDTNTMSLDTKLGRMFKRGSSQNISAYLPPDIQKQWAGTFTGRPQSVTNANVSEHKVDNMLTQFVSSNGMMVDFIPNRTMQSHAIALVDDKQLTIPTLATVVTRERDPNTFRNRQGRIFTYLTLSVGEPRSHGGWTETGLV